MGRMAVMLRRPGACPPPRSILLLLLVVACAAGFIHASQSNENAGQYPSIAKEPVPIVLPLLHLPKRSAQNPHPFRVEEVDDDELFQTRSSPEPPLRPIAHTYQGLDCYGRWKFRALLDDASAAGGYKVHNGTVPLCDNTAEFYAQIGVGTPPQYFYVQVDTGSSLFAVPVAGCKSCAGHASDRYHRNMSSTSQGYSCADIFHCTAMRCYGQTFDCGFHSQYQDQSYINGMILKEKITFANRTFDGMFGAIYEAAGTFSATSQVDGILGLSYFSDLSCLPNCVPPLWDSMVSAFNLPDVFALDLPEPNMGVAQLILGGTGRARPSELNWTPIMQESYYVVDLKEIGVGGVPIQFDPADMGQVIVDSGTTLLILPRPIFEALKEGFLSGNCSVEGICEHARHGDNIFNTCFDSKTLSEKTNNYSLYPSISFKFPGVQVDLNPHQYLRTQMRSSQPCVEMAVAPIDNTLTILGDTFMRDRVTVFDRANKRVGFTNAKPYTWNAPPAEAWVWWTIACSLSGFTLFCTFVLGLFVYGARRYKRRRTPHYEPLLLAGDELGELAEDLDFTLPVSSSSSRPLRAGAGGGSGDLLLNPALDNEHHHSSSSDDEVLPPPSTSPAHHDVVVA